jgi:PAS domain S-box-containing protein
VEERETSFRLLADNVPGTLWVTNPAGECTYLSARWYATTGQTVSEGLGLGWTRAVQPDDATQAGTEFMAANARRMPYNGLFRLRQHDGEYRWVTDKGLPRFDATGAYDGMVGSVVDVHEQKLAELALRALTTELRTSRDEAQDLAKELADSNQQLTRTNVDLDNFIYTASHDLKAPISNIEGLLYLLHEELPVNVAQNERVGPTLARMLDSVERFKRTIGHLTEVSKLQKENEPATALVNLAAVVEEVRQDLWPQLAAANARLVIDVSALPPVQFAEKNLRSVVYNLLSNAIKYRHPDRRPHIDVLAHVRPGHTVLEVHDNGLGLAAAHLPRIFGMFQRFHDHVEGTGIGLYMVKRMVENAGGRIEVHSQLGTSTTFFVYLPHANNLDGHSFPAYLSS